MATTEKDRVKTGLSEVRMLVLGAQILLGFQYRASFEPGFPLLPQGARYLQVVALLLLVASAACLIAPAPHHRIVSRGHATARTERYTKRMALFALVPFALALGMNLGVVLARQIGPLAAGCVGAAVGAAALLCWFGPAFARQRSGDSKKDEMVSTKDKITDLLTEARIVLPGVQALLGLQFASYLTSAFEKLSSAAKVVNTASLFLLVLAMVLLMTPAPYHRLVEGGENTEHFEHVTERLVLAALAPLALGVAGDVFVVADVVLGGWAAATAALACVAGMAALWFSMPLLAVRRHPG